LGSGVLLRANRLLFNAVYAFARRWQARGTFLFFAALVLYANAVGYSQETTPKISTERSKKNCAFSFRELVSEGLENENKSDDLQGRFRFLSYLEETPSLNVVQERPFSIPGVERDSFATYASDSTIFRAASISDFTLKPYRCRLFGRVSGAYGTQEGQGSESYSGGFDVKSYGAGIGQDWSCTSNLIWGYGIQLNELSIRPSVKSGYKADFDVLAGYLQLGVFGSLWHFDVAAGASKNWQKQIELKEDDESRITSSQRNYEGEFGIRIDRGYTRIEPRVNFRVVTLSEPEGAESYLISYFLPNEFSDDSYRLKLGSKFSWEYETFLATFKPYLSADWEHEFGNEAIYIIGDSLRYPVAYRFGKHKMARDRFDLGGGIDVALHHCSDVYLRYDAEFAKGYVDYFVDAGFNIKF